MQDIIKLELIRLLIFFNFYKKQLRKKTNGSSPLWYLTDHFPVSWLKWTLLSDRPFLIARIRNLIGNTVNIIKSKSNKLSI